LSNLASLLPEDAPEILRREGYLVVTLPRALTELSAEIYLAAKTFFQRPGDLKARDSSPDEFQGWRALGGEFSIVPERPDLHESFWVSGTNNQNLFLRFSAEAQHLHELLTAYGNQIAELERRLTALIMQSLGVVGDAAFECTSQSDIQCLFYRPAAHGTRAFLQEEHEDAVYMTFTKADVPGLEVECGDGVYRALDLAPDQIAILPGEILSLLTGGLIRPLMHRVARHPTDRFSPTDNESGRASMWRRSRNDP
jgi:isopenicillin N synthase-like dioxygenase